MATTLGDKTELGQEKALLLEVFEREERPDGDYHVYSYDNRYYKVLSACAKLRLKTRNLPEGNPSYIEIRSDDWQRVFGAPKLTAAPAPAAPAPSRSANVRVDVTTVRPEPADEPDIEEAVEKLATRSQNGPASTRRMNEEGPRMELTRGPKADDLQAGSYHSKLQALKSREQALATREEAVRIREEAVQEREGSVAGAEEDLFITEQRLQGKEKDLDGFSQDLEQLRRDLDEEMAELRVQKQKIIDLADHLRRTASGLLSEE